MVMIVEAAAVLVGSEKLAPAVASSCAVLFFYMSIVRSLLLSGFLIKTGKAVFFAEPRGRLRRR